MSDATRSRSSSRGAVQNRAWRSVAPWSSALGFTTNTQTPMKTWLLASCVLFAAPGFAQQTAPEISFDSVPDYPKLPAGMNFGEVAGVAVNSKGHVFIFTRSNSA